jgi:hypothetical protein
MFSWDSSEPLHRVASFSERVSGWQCWINGLHESAMKHLAGNSLSKFLATRINQLQASQNAAALLFDLGTVDIR